jgi:hypothetical protein
MADVPPRQTSITLTGKLFPWALAGIVRGRPVFISLSGTSDLYLPCFTDAADLHAVMFRAGAPFDRIKQIDDEVEFLESLPREVEGKRVRIMVDPSFTDDGKTRWTEVLLN